MFDFDRQIERRGTGSLKYDFAVERGKPADVLPLWVADMDFGAPQPVLDALHRAVDHGIFGYSEVKADYFDAVAGWFAQRFDWQSKLDRGWRHAAAICGKTFPSCVSIWKSASRRSGLWSRKEPTTHGWIAPRWV